MKQADKKMIEFYGDREKGAPFCGLGFTLIELLVTMSILVVITAMMLANYPKFSEALALKRAAQEVALTIRQAQVYGLSVREFGAGSGIFPGYGVHFDMADGPDSFILFADINNNKSYDAGDGCGGLATECVQMFKINTGDKISKLCGNSATVSPGGCPSLGLLDVVYLRPNPTVTLKGDGLLLVPSASIVLSSLNGDKRTIKVWLSGQIGVE